MQRHRAELNRINVFPVPDGDTGTNLALTAASISDRLRLDRPSAVGDVASAAAEAAILGARGNCGMILSHFLLGLAEALGARARISVPEFATALGAAVAHVYRSLERPVEGTILTVMRAVAEEAERLETADFGEAAARLVAHARIALERTPELLPELRKAGVVDAGAKGFVHLLEGFAGHLSGDAGIGADPLPERPGREAPAAAAMAELGDEAERFRYCTEALVRGSALPEGEAVREILRAWGDSLVAIRSGELLKIHLHTDDPQRVFAYLRGLGSLAAHKAEDMRAQHETVRTAAGHLRLARRSVTVVTDTACDLPEEIVRAHGIRLVPLTLIVGDRTLRDRLDITPAKFADSLRQGAAASTSQPPPAAFLEAYDRAAEDGEEIIAIILGSALSGTFGSAEAAARLWSAQSGGETPIHVVDSRGASLTQGFLALRAAELAEAGVPATDIVPELARIRDRSGLLFTVSTYDRLLASGRVGRGRAFLGKILDVRPVLSLDRRGGVVSLGRVRGGEKVLPRMMEVIAERVGQAERIRFGIIHVAAEEIAAGVAEALTLRFGPREIVVSPATPVIAIHTGPGTWGIAYQVED